MGQNQKRYRPSDIDTIGKNKRAKTPAIEEDDDDVTFLLRVDVNSFPVLRELLTSPEKFISTAAVTGNEESCSSSFSYHDSSVMASLDFTVVCGVHGGWRPRVGVTWRWLEDRTGITRSDEFDEMLARFLEEDVCEN